MPEPGFIATLATVALLIIGCAFCLIASLGIVIMPDLYNRMQAASKAVTLGATCIALAVATYFQDGDIVTRVLLVVVFLFVTVPVASHLIVRAGHHAGEPLAPETVMDEFPREETTQKTGSPPSYTPGLPGRSPDPTVPSDRDARDLG
jgi:monovalent cation/proton antiporter MnhG/PhaG subunit